MSLTKVLSICHSERSFSELAKKNEVEESPEWASFLNLFNLTIFAPRAVDSHNFSILLEILRLHSFSHSLKLVPLRMT